MSRFMLSKTYCIGNTLGSKAGRQRGQEDIIHINKILGKTIGLIQVMQLEDWFYLVLQIQGDLNSSLGNVYPCIVEGFLFIYLFSL